MLAQADTLGLSGESVREVVVRDVAGADQDLSEQSLVEEETAARGVGVFGFEPYQRLVAKARAEVEKDGSKSREGIDVVGADNADGHSEGEAKPVEARGASHAHTDAD